MKLLADSFNVLPLHDAVRALAEDNLPPRAVCITFDDGYRSIHDFALPILKEFGLPATVFVTTGYISKSNMWNDRILEVMRQLPAGAIDLSDIGLGVHQLEALSEREQTVRSLMEKIKYLPPDTRLGIVQNLEERFGIALPHGLMLTPQMIVNLAQSNVEIGGHTISHPILSALDDDNAREEIFGNKQHLENIIGKPLRFFAYPNGKLGRDFNERHIQMVKEAGYIAAFTTAKGAATHHNDPFQLPRSRPWDPTPFRFGIRLLSWFSQKST
ncbi:MAG: polysaccharide deacetylase family protein [Pseudomonadota bacterium]